MSYDVLLLPRRPDQSWQDALEEAEQRSASQEPLSAERLGQWAEVTRRLADHLPAARQHLGTTSASLEDRATGLQVHLYAHEAAVNHPHGDPSDETVLRLAGEAVTVLVEVTGLQPYDRQSDDDYLPLNRAGQPGPPATEQAAPAPAPKTARPALSRNDRARGLRYLVVGLLLVLGGATVLLRDDPPGIVWAVIVIGVLDIGLAAWTLSGRAPSRGGP